MMFVCKQIITPKCDVIFEQKSFGISHDKFTLISISLCLTFERRSCIAVERFIK